MANKPETPFHKIMLTRQKLKLYGDYGDRALDGQTLAEMIADASQCIETLIEFRNIINGMVSLDEAPRRAVMPYLSDDVIAEFANS